MATGKRPEHCGPAEVYFDGASYSNSRITKIQQKLSERALELMDLPAHSCYILDVGCGSGLSGEWLTENDHVWMGVDISSSMLDVAKEREVEGDLILSDMGEGMPFRAGTFDGVISVSALQWLCNADKKYHVPSKRMLKFFTTLYAVMARGARAVFQFYPENAQQLELLTQQAMRAGFTGGLVVDYPNSTKAKKMFLCLFAGGGTQELPKGLGTDTSTNNSIRNTNTRAGIRGKAPKKSKDWIVEKKERRKRQGKEVRQNTKYTGRKRPTQF